MHELSLAFRSLVRRPTFAIAVIATLGLSIGVTTGFFGVIDALLLRPLPGVDPNGLVNLYVTEDGDLAGSSGFSRPTFLDLQERARPLLSLEAFAGRSFALGDEAATGLVGGQLVSGGFFDMLGTKAARGRLLDSRDDERGAERVVVITHALWQQRYGSREDVLGRTLRVNGRPFTLVGITEKGFSGQFVGFSLDVFLPLASAPDVATEIKLDERGDHGLELVGRLPPGVALSAAEGRLSALAKDLAQDFPESHRGHGIDVRAYTGLDADLHHSVLGFVALLAVVGLLVLLVACVNVAGLVLARTASRSRELAVRAALGASRGALIRPQLIETLLLFAAGGLLGLALVSPAARVLNAFLPDLPIPLHLDVSTSWRVGLFAASVTLLTALSFGLAPALSATRLDIAGALKLGGRNIVPGRQSGRQVFVSAQIGLCFVLLVGGFLFLRELQRARELDPGFRLEGVSLVTVDASVVDRSPAVRRAFFESWLERVRTDPRVESASLVRNPPLGLGRPSTRLLVDGLEPPSPEGFVAGWNAVAPGYFETLGIPLFSGRDFDVSDGVDGERVAIISRSTASRLFFGQSALNRHLRRAGQVLRVVGVVGDVAADRSGSRDGLWLYVPFAQSDARRMSLVLHARTPPFVLAIAEAHALDPDLPVLAATSLAQYASAALFPQRMAASLTITFAGFALVLAAVGLYGVVAGLVEHVGTRLPFGQRSALLLGPFGSFWCCRGYGQ